MEKKVNALLQSSEKITFKTHESYSPEEVFAAGGSTAFAIKKGKTAHNFFVGLNEIPEIEKFSDEEWSDLIEQLKNDK
jgi:hypothetical protein